MNKNSFLNKNRSLTTLTVEVPDDYNMSNKNEKENNKLTDPHRGIAVIVDNATTLEKQIGSCCYPESYWYKGIGLLFMCSIGFGSYFCYDNLGALEASRL